MILSDGFFIQRAACWLAAAINDGIAGVVVPWFVPVLQKGDNLF